MPQVWQKLFVYNTSSSKYKNYNMFVEYLICFRFSVTSAMRKAQKLLDMTNVFMSCSYLQTHLQKQLQVNKLQCDDEEHPEQVAHSDEVNELQSDDEEHPEQVAQSDEVKELQSDDEELIEQVAHSNELNELQSDDEENETVFNTIICSNS